MQEMTSHRGEEAIAVVYGNDMIRSGHLSEQIENNHKNCAANFMPLKYDAPNLTTIYDKLNENAEYIAIVAIIVNV